MIRVGLVTSFYVDNIFYEFNLFYALQILCKLVLTVMKQLFFIELIAEMFCWVNQCDFKRLMDYYNSI